MSIRCGERLAEAGIEPSAGSAGDRYDNALAKTINRLYWAEIFHPRSSTVGSTSSCRIAGPRALADRPLVVKVGWLDAHILAARHALYIRARNAHPARWSGTPRNRSKVGAVTLNPERDAVVQMAAGAQHTQPKAA